MKRSLRTKCTVHRIDNDSKETLAVNLTVWRERFGLTQKDLSSACGVSVGTISRSESGVHEIDVESEYILAEFWGVPIEALRLPDGVPYDPTYMGSLTKPLAAHLKTLKPAGSAGTPAAKLQAARRKEAEARAKKKLVRS